MFCLVSGFIHANRPLAWNELCIVRSVETPTAPRGGTRELLTPDEVAELLGVRPSTLRIWRHRAIGPDAIQVGPQVWRYERDALHEYLQQNRLSARREAAV